MRIHRLLLVGLAVVSMPSFSQTMENLVLRDGLYYQLSSEQPFSGEITGKNQGSFKDGQKHGAWIYFHENGSVKSKGRFKKGVKHGPWRGFYENGQPFYKGGYSEGKRQGPWVKYYEDGTIFYRGNFENDRRQGPWTGFNPDGTPWPYRTGFFKNGTKVHD